MLATGFVAEKTMSATTQHAANRNVTIRTAAVTDAAEVAENAPKIVNALSMPVKP